MGKASGGDRQNLGGIVGRFHVITAKHGGRAPIAVPKGTGRRGVGRRTTRLPGDGGRGKDKARDEPQGGVSRRAFGARYPRSYKGSRPLCHLGIFCRDLLAGHSFWTSHAA